MSRRVGQLHSQGRWADRRPRGKVEVADLCAATPAAEARLWRFLAELDLVATVVAGDRPIDDLLPWLLVDARAAKQTDAGDFLWVRPLDVPALLTARAYERKGGSCSRSSTPTAWPPVASSSMPHPTVRRARPTDEPADVTMPVRTLGTAALGGVRLAMLHRRRLARRAHAGAVATADASAGAGVAPWCNTWF